jgi:hypothetical protein
MSELTSVLRCPCRGGRRRVAGRREAEFLATLTAGVNRLNATLTAAVPRGGQGRRAPGRRRGVDAGVVAEALPADATAIVTTGRRLEQLPATAEAFAAGEISAAHARAITTAVTPTRVAKAAEAGIDLAETDRQ